MIALVIHPQFHIFHLLGPERRSGGAMSVVWCEAVQLTRNALLFPTERAKNAAIRDRGISFFSPVVERKRLYAGGQQE